MAPSSYLSNVGNNLQLIVSSYLTLFSFTAETSWAATIIKINSLH